MLARVDAWHAGRSQRKQRVAHVAVVLEEHFGEPGLLGFIKPYRRETYTSDKAKVFLAGFLTRTRRRRLAQWTLYCKKRQRCRFLVATTLVRWKTLNELDALLRWRRHTLLVTSAVTAQRYTRGWMGRLARWYMREMERGTVVMQTKYRGN